MENVYILNFVSSSDGNLCLSIGATRASFVFILDIYDSMKAFGDSAAELGLPSGQHDVQLFSVFLTTEAIEEEVDGAVDDVEQFVHRVCQRVILLVQKGSSA